MEQLKKGRKEEAGRKKSYRGKPSFKGPDYKAARMVGIDNSKDIFSSFSWAGLGKRERAMTWGR